MTKLLLLTSLIGLAACTEEEPNVHGGVQLQNSTGNCRDEDGDPGGVEVWAYRAEKLIDDWDLGCNLGFNIYLEPGTYDLVIQYYSEEPLFHTNVYEDSFRHRNVVVGETNVYLPDTILDAD